MQKPSYSSTETAYVVAGRVTVTPDGGEPVCMCRAPAQMPAHASDTYARARTRAHTRTHTHTHTHTHITHHTLRAHAHAQARKHVDLAQLPAQGRSFLRPLVLLPPARTGKFTEHTFCGGCLAQVEVKAGGMYTFPRGMSCTWEVR